MRTIQEIAALRLALIAMVDDAEKLGVMEDCMHHTLAMVVALTWVLAEDEVSTNSVLRAAREEIERALKVTRYRDN